MSSDLGATSKDIWFLEERGSDFLTLSSRDRQRRGVFWKIKYLTLTSILHTPLGEKKTNKSKCLDFAEFVFRVFFWLQPIVKPARPMCVVEPTFVEILMHGHLDLRNNKTARMTVPRKIWGWHLVPFLMKEFSYHLFFLGRFIGYICICICVCIMYYVLCIYTYMCVLHVFFVGRCRFLFWGVGKALEMTVSAVLHSVQPRNLVLRCFTFPFVRGSFGDVTGWVPCRPRNLMARI